jgi:hypothetical protein
MVVVRVRTSVNARKVGSGRNAVDHHAKTSNFVQAMGYAVCLITANAKHSGKVLHVTYLTALPIKRRRLPAQEMVSASAHGTVYAMTLTSETTARGQPPQLLLQRRKKLSYQEIERV